MPEIDSYRRDSVTRSKDMLQQQIDTLQKRLFLLKKKMRDIDDELDELTMDSEIEESDGGMTTSTIGISGKGQGVYAPKVGTIQKRTTKNTPKNKKKRKENFDAVLNYTAKLFKKDK